MSITSRLSSSSGSFSVRAATNGGLRATLNSSGSDRDMLGRLVPSAASVVVKSTSTGGLQQASAGVTLKNIVATDTSRRLDTLVDVISDDANTVTGSTLVYDSATDKYVVKLLDLDGGNF